MKTKRLLLLLFVLFLSGYLFSGVKTIFIKSQKKAEILTPLKTIEFDEEAPVSQTFIIAKGRIYFVNPLEKTLYICDLNGNEIKILNSKGKGPGEFMMPTTIYEDKKNKNICVVDQMNRRTSYFDYDGNHIKDVNFEYTKIPMDLTYIDDSKLFFYMGIEIDKGKQSVLSKPTIDLIKKDTTITIYSETFNPLSFNLGNSKIPSYTIIDDKIFVAELSPESYQIDVFDKNGKKVFIIKKKISKVKRSKEAIKEIEEKLNKAKKMAKSSGSNIDLNFKGYQYANLINLLLSDNRGNLWVLTVDKNGYYFDVIDSNGKVIKKVETKNKKQMIYKIYNNTLYELIGDEDTGFKLNIYKI